MTRIGLALAAFAIVVSLPTGSPSGATSAAASCGMISQNGWALTAGHVSGRGLTVTSAFYNNQKVAHDLSTPLIRVQYAGPHGRINDKLVDAVFNATQGCVKSNIGTTGFKVTTQYVFGAWPACGTYKYDDTYEFFNTGNFYHYVVVWGPGFACDDAVSWYGPEFRHDMDVTQAGNNFFDEWTGAWANRSVEGNYYYQPPYLSPNYDWRNYVTGKQLTQAPAFISSAPDNWALRYNGAELGGSPVVPPLGTWANGENINNADIVNWFLPYGWVTSTQCQPSFPCKIGIFNLTGGY